MEVLTEKKKHMTKSLHRIVNVWKLTTDEIQDGKDNKWLLSVLVADSLTHEITHKKVAI